MHTLIDYLTYTKPFGPEDAAQVIDPFCRGQLFQNQNALYRRLDKHPSIVLGRKGSGKTAFLHCSHTIGDYKAVIEISSASAFATIMRSVQAIGVHSRYVEPVAQLWEAVFWLALIYSAPAQLGQTAHTEPLLPPSLREAIGRYIYALVPNAQKLPLFLVAALNSFSIDIERANCPPEDVGEFISSFAVGSHSLEILKSALYSEMEKHHAAALLLIDSLDTRVDPSDTYDIAPTEADLATSGLMKALASFRRYAKIFEVRFCLPSERHFHFMKLSANPAKDMVSKVTLNWRASELVCIAAHRLLLFFREHVDYAGPYGMKYSKVDTTNRREAIALLQAGLGKNVMNQLGQEESTISYVMRHTQLLPRHLLLYLNSIYSTAHERGETFEGEGISDLSIREGISKVEQTICYEIFAAYRHLYPEASDLCEACIPELPLVFTQGELQSVFTKYGRKVVGTDDYNAFRRMLVELGIVGRVLRETDLYIEGEFEYSSEYKMILGSSDKMCLHPVFSQVYHAKVTADAKVVYPFGSDADE